MQLKELTLHSKNLDQQQAFYSDILNLPVTRPETNILLVELRESLIRFVADPEATPYHFAINIPSTSEDEALEWLKKRVKIQQGPDGDIVDFSAWNAKSLYFYDADQNIVEFIARRNLNYSLNKPFSADDLIEISEIGVACDDMDKNADFLLNTLNLEAFGKGSDDFRAIGEEQLLFIVIDRNKKDWFPTSDKALPSRFNCLIEKTEGENRMVGIEFDGDILRLGQEIEM